MLDRFRQAALLERKAVVDLLHLINCFLSYSLCSNAGYYAQLNTITFFREIEDVKPTIVKSAILLIAALSSSTLWALANPDQRATLENTPITINVLDNDIADPEVIITLDSEALPANGTAQVSPNGRSILYTPNNDFVGNDTFFYIIGEGSTERARVIVSVQALQVDGALNLTNNQKALARAIDAFCLRLRNSEQPLNANQENLATRCQGVRRLASEAAAGNEQAAARLIKALNKVSGEEITAHGEAAAGAAQSQGNNIDQRLALLRSGNAGSVNLSSFNIIIDGKALNADQIAELFRSYVGGTAAGDDLKTGSDAFSRWGVFLNGSLGAGDNETTDNEAGYDYDSTGITFGVDYRINSSSVIGVAYGINDTETDFEDNGGKLNSDNTSLLLYGTYYRDRYYFDGFLGTADIDYGSFRNINYVNNDNVAISAAARSETTGSQTMLGFSGNYDFNWGAFTLTPYGGLDYIKTEIDAFQEGNGGGWEIGYEEQTIKSMTISAGARASYALSRENMVMVHQLRAALYQELEDDAHEVSTFLVYDPDKTEMVISSNPGDSSFMRLGFSGSWVFKGGFSAFLDYEVVAGLDNASQSVLTVGGRYEL